MIDEQKASERTVSDTVAKLATSSSSFYKATTTAGRAITRGPGTAGE